MNKRQDVYAPEHPHDQDKGDSLADHYPPGPADDPEDYESLLLAVEVGLVELTNEVRDGHRVWREAPHRYSLSEYPPGLNDDVLLYGVMFQLVDEGRARPTHEMRNGSRVFERVGPSAKPN